MPVDTLRNREEAPCHLGTWSGSAQWRGHRERSGGPAAGQDNRKKAGPWGLATHGPARRNVMSSIAATEPRVKQAKALIRDLEQRGYEAGFPADLSTIAQHI